jgi:putative transposase
MLAGKLCFPMPYFPYDNLRLSYRADRNQGYPTPGQLRVIAMGRSRYRIRQDQVPYFQTCTVVGWLPVFTRPETAQVLLDSFTYLQSHDAFSLYGFVLLENHIHFVSGAQNHAGCIKRFKSFTARTIIDYLEERRVSVLLQQLAYYKRRHKTDSTYQLWQEGSHPEEILDEEMMRQKLEYIHNNPVKRGYVDDPCHWRYSSARNYAGQEGLIRVVTDW